MSEPFQVVLADPGWQYTQPLKMSDGVKRSSKDQYRTMTVQEICDLYQTSIVGPGGRRGYSLARPATIAGHPIADVALLALWITAPLLLEGVHTRVCDAWGFAPKQIVPWIKGRLVAEHGFTSCMPKLVIQPGMGALTRGCVEYLVLATRGQYTKLVKSHSENGLLLAEEEAIIVAPKSSHSRKPVEQYALLEKLFPGPYLELFPGPARPERDGWTRWGDHMPPSTTAEEPPLPLETAADEIDDGSQMRRTRAKHSAAVEECLKLFKRLNDPNDDDKTNHRRQMLLTAEIQCLSLAEQKAYYKAIRPIMDARRSERAKFTGFHAVGCAGLEYGPCTCKEPLPEPPVSWS